MPSRIRIKKKECAISLGLLLMIFIFDFFAKMYSSIYFTYYWADLTIHFIAGASIYLLLDSIISNLNIYKTFILVFSIALLWEVFELILEPTKLYSNNFITDTLSDIGIALIGAIIVNRLIKYNLK